MSEHVSAIIEPMFHDCPKCKAKPMQPCFKMVSGTRYTLRYTHAERNRA